MYTNEDNRFFLEKSKEIIDNFEDADFLKKNIDGIKNVIRFHEHRYYVMNDPLIADFEFDRIYDTLKKTEKIIYNQVSNRHYRSRHHHHHDAHAPYYAHA
jgi:DNA ligase (NAD+)